MMIIIVIKSYLILGGRPSLLTHHSQGSCDWEGGRCKSRLNIHAFLCCLGLWKWCYLPRPRWPVACLDIVIINIQKNCPPIFSDLSATVAWFLPCFHECFRRKVLNMYFVSKTVWILLLIAYVFLNLYLAIYSGFLYFFALWFYIWHCKDKNIHVNGVYSMYQSTLGFWQCVLSLFLCDFSIDCFKLKIKINKLFTSFSFIITCFAAVLGMVPRLWACGTATLLWSSTSRPLITSYMAVNPELFSDIPT